jgi:hypothetical protein
MPNSVTPAILLPYSEYDRLLAIEKRMHSLLLERDSRDKKTIPATVTSAEADKSDESATHLEGAGALLSPTHASVPGLQDNLKDSVPSDINTSALPPPNIPVMFRSTVSSNPELVKQQVAMEKRLKFPTGLPLNDPSGTPDPTSSGEPVTHQFVAKRAKGEFDDDSDSEKNYYVGLDFESDSN